MVLEWMAGPDDDLMSLQEALLLDHSWYEGNDMASDRDDDALARAIDIIEDAIPQMEPTPLNLRRVRRWCKNYTLPAGYEVMLTRFSTLMTDAEWQRCYRTASSLFDVDVVAAWCSMPENGPLAQA